METQTAPYLQHLRSLRYDDYLWDVDVPNGHECCEGNDYGCSRLVDDNPDSVHGVRDAG
jgi:hypothetical protein